jgi:hypothetical protein
LPLALALRFVEFAHQYSIVKDLNYSNRIANPAESRATDFTDYPDQFCVIFAIRGYSSGDDRVRTDGLRSASAALSQLSYIPLPQTLSNVGLGRVELPTSRLSGVRSNHLSYRPDGVRLGIVRKVLRQKTYRRSFSNLGRVSAISNNTLRKEVIQPQVLLRLPCYDFTPITSHTLDGYLLAVELPASSTTGFRDVTGGVYKARERIHRCLLISDY